MSRRRRLLMRAVRALERERRRRGVRIYRHAEVYFGGVRWPGVTEVRVERSTARLDPPPL